MTLFSLLLNLSFLPSFLKNQASEAQLVQDIEMANPSSSPIHKVDDIPESTENTVSPLPVPDSTTSAASMLPYSHPIIESVQEHEIASKVLIGGLITVVMTSLFNKDGKTPRKAVEFHLIGLFVGGLFIWFGIAFKRMFPLVASVTELVGITLFFLVFYLLALSLLLPEITVVAVLCFLFFLVPVAVVIVHLIKYCILKLRSG